MTNVQKPARYPAVGARNLYLCDAAPENRRLSVRLWYPAVYAPGCPPAPVFGDGETAAILGKLQGISGGEKLSSLYGEALWEAPAESGSFPLLIFSHGYSLFNTQNTIQCEALAGQGYIVAGIAHTGDCVEAVFPDETMRLSPVRYQQSQEEGVKIVQLYGEDLYAAGAGRLKQWFAGSVQNSYCDTWRGDVSFTLDQLEGMGKEGWPLQARIDWERVGIFGMSYGGSTAFYTPHFDQRLKACVDLDGALFGGQAEMPALDIPAMLCGQRADILRDCGLPADSKAVCIQFPDAEHGDFTNLPLWCQRSGIGIIANTGGVDNENMQQALTALLIDFFDTHLRGETSRLDAIASAFSREMQVL